jgi:hypothetical protein
MHISTHDQVCQESSVQFLTLAILSHFRRPGRGLSLRYVLLAKRLTRIDNSKDGRGCEGSCDKADSRPEDFACLHAKGRDGSPS